MLRMCVCGLSSVFRLCGVSRLSLCMNICLSLLCHCILTVWCIAFKFVYEHLFEFVMSLYSDCVVYRV